MLIIDVSHHQGSINWSKVKGKVDAAILRLGYGTDKPTHDDRYFEENYQECKRYGIPVGVYLYSYATDVAKAESEAAHALRLLEGKEIEGHVWFDSEQDGTQSVAKICAASFCEIIKAAGFKPGIYASMYWFNKHLSNFDYYDKWVARYSVNAPSVSGAAILWQYSSDGTVDGISSRVDMNKELTNAIAEELKDDFAGMTTVDILFHTLEGKYGEGDIRRKVLGGRYEEIQKLINRIANATAEELARDTWHGNYGTGDIRAFILGSRYEEVMAVINHTTEKRTEEAKIEGKGVANKFSKKYAKKYTTARSTTLRTGGASNYTSVCEIPAGESFICYGYYSDKNDVWLWGTYKKKKTGFVNLKDLK